MRSLFSRQSVREAPQLVRWLIASIIASLAILLCAESPNGAYLGHLTDHFHHARATWTFFVLGFEVYTRPFGETAPRVLFLQPGLPWAAHPVAYPPGMFVVFAPLALLGRFVQLSTFEFGKIAIAYLMLITHAALWAFAWVSRRVGSPLWTGVVVFLWIFSVRISLLGFYDGAWPLTAALAVHAMQEARPARAVAWFVASALISYRAACLAPIAAVAFWQMVRGTESLRTKAIATASALLGGVIVVTCFVTLLRYSPKGDDGAHGLDPRSFLAFVMYGLGVGAAALLARGASLLVGACVATSTVLSVYHAGHNWHGFLLIAPIFAFTLASKRPLWAQIVVALWLVTFLEMLFGYPPLLFLDELLRFIAMGGGFV